ncbi:hypothetical protein Tco_0019329 [Tanacetum coccineum]
MDVKSAFLYGKIEEEVHRFEKALYGLHQAPRAWHKGDILLVQVYVDDIIFGSTKEELCFAFEKLMIEKFQDELMGELTFLLALQSEAEDDYAGASLDRKSTTGGCQFLGCRLISWQCKKQTMVANSTTEAEYVAASSYGKKIIITESTVRRDLQLEDAEGVNCLPNSTIFEQLVLMGPKTTAWNEFSSTMASDDIQAKIDVDQSLLKDLQAQEQEELSDAEKATLFQQLLEKRRKHFAAKRAEEQRNKPPTQAQQRKIMCTYLKNMEGYKLKDLKLKGFDSIQEMFDIAFKRVNTFEDFRTELVEGKEKRAGAELVQENEEEVTIDAIPLAVKSPRIVGWKIHKEGRKSYYQMIRANGKSQMYMVFSHMIISFDRQDLEDLYKLVKAIYGSTRPVESMDYLLWNDMKIIFEPHVEDEVWKLQNGYKVLDWKLYDSCGVHSLMMQSMQIYMLVEKKYPLTPPTLLMMLEKKLQIDYESEMAYQLCKLIIKQLKK